MKTHSRRCGWFAKRNKTQNEGSIFGRMGITLQSSRALPSLPLSEHVSWLFCYLYSHFPLSKIHTDVWRALFIYHINWNSKVVIEENLFDGVLPQVGEFLRVYMCVCMRYVYMGTCVWMWIEYARQCAGVCMWVSFGSAVCSHPHSCTIFTYINVVLIYTAKPSQAKANQTEMCGLTQTPPPRLSFLQVESHKYKQTYTKLNKK